MAQRFAPDSRIVYVDNDPIVLAHAQALLTSSREGACAYIDADLRDPSFLTISHPASDLDTGLDVATRQFNQSGGDRATNRDRAAVARMFDGCDLVEPGVARVAEWRPDSEPEASRHAAVWAGVARKP